MRFAAFAGGVLIALCGSAVIGAVCEDALPVTHSGKRFALGEQYPLGRPSYSISEPGSRYLRANVHVDHPAGRWILAVRDEARHLIQTFTSADFTSSSDQWTSRIPGSKAYFELDRGDATNLVVTFDYFVAMPQDVKGSYYSLQGANPTYEPLYTSPNVTAVRKRFGDYIGFLMTSDGQSSWSCSGVLITPSLFLTNWHCGAPEDTPDNFYWVDTVIKESVIDLSWDDDALSSDYVVTKVAATNPDLDYALLRVAPIGRAAVVRGPVIDSHPLVAGNLFIIHHPVAHQKRISECTVKRLDHASWRDNVAGTDFTHNCDTEAGSSGAPVFNDSGVLVGLHHRGFDRDAQCRAIDKENKAVKISQIIADIRAKDPRLVSDMRFAP